MNKIEFTDAFNRLGKAFSVTKIEDRAEVYFDKLKHVDAHVFERACDAVLSEDDRFPTIATLMERCRSLTPEEKITKQPCDVCDGFGNVFIYGVAYRGDCPHGERYSKKIKVAPRDYVGQQQELIRQEADWMEVYSVERKPNKVMFNPSKGKYPHWWIEKSEAL